MLKSCRHQGGTTVFHLQAGLVNLLQIQLDFYFLLTMSKGKEKGPKQLSRTLMGLKFMKRRIVNEEQQDGNKIDPEDAWHAASPVEGKKPVRPVNMLSYSACMELVEIGHLSFGKFNKEVEREMQAIKREEQGELSDSEKSVSDNEMAQRYENLIGTVGKKVKRKAADNIDFLDTQESSIPKKRRKVKKK